MAACLIKPVRHSDLIQAIRLALGDMLASRGNLFALSSSGDQIPAVRPPERPSCGLKVLLAEDHPINQRVAQRMLQKLGHEVVITADGRQALEAYESGGFDVILMDIQMPEMDGFETLQAIRAIETGSGRHTPVVAMTAHAMQGDRERCFSAGFDGYLSKPIHQADLAAALDPHIHAE